MNPENYILIDSKTPIERIIEFVNEADGIAAENMYTPDWQNNSATFLYKLYVQKVFDDENMGFYAIYEHDGKVIAGSGVCRLHESNFCIQAVRAFTLSKYKKQTMSFHQWCVRKSWDYINKNYDGYIVCFNKYNKRLFEKAYKINSVSPSKIDTYYYDNNRVFIPAKKWNKICDVNHTEQYVLYNSLTNLSEIERYLSGIEIDVRV
jgi:hypothetical protein